MFGLKKKHKQEQKRLEREKREAEKVAHREAFDKVVTYKWNGR